jgi:hypothetical protein
MDSGLYDALKYVTLVVLPALTALYFGLGQIWNFPAIEQVTGSSTVVITFLGLLLNKSSNAYVNSPRNLVGAKPMGKLVVKQDVDGTASGMRFEAYEDPFILPDQRQVVFDVRREQQV